MFKEGDYFYMRETDESGATVYPVCYCLKIDEDNETVHISVFTDQSQPPAPADINEMEMRIMHAPIDINGFVNPTVFYNRPVTEEDLEGYYAYLKEGEGQEADDETIQEALEHFQRGGEFYQKEQFEEAIDAYIDALEAYPDIFEAADNAGFCCMSISEFEKAIDFFTLSEEINEPSFLTIFSIGECLLNLGKRQDARQQFLKAGKLDGLDDEQRKIVDSFLKQTA